MPYALNAAHATGQTITAADQNAIAAAINQGAEHNPGLFVASSEATAAEKAGADYLCDGVGDEVEINAAFAALGALASPGGTVTLSTGRFWLQNPVAHHVNNTTLAGAGHGATTLRPQTNTTNLTACVVFGDTADVKNCALRDFGVYGLRDAGTPPTTGHGVILYGKNSRVADLFLLYVVQDGLRLDSHNGNYQGFENVVVNVNVQYCGNDGIACTLGSGDCEVIRCVLTGNQKPAGGSAMTLAAGNYGRYGISNAGARNKFLLCHPYFWQWGFYNTGGNVSIIGGEYETNQPGGGIALAGVAGSAGSGDGLVLGAMVYDNLGSAIAVGTGIGTLGGNSGCRIIGNRVMISSHNGVVTNGILVYHSNRNLIADNQITDLGASSFGIMIDGDSASNEVRGNVVWTSTAGALGAKVQGSANHNTFVRNHFDLGIAEGGTANFNAFVDNVLDAGTITLLGANSSAGGNTGYVSSTQGVASVADGGTIAHGLAKAPTAYGATATVANHVVAVTAVSATTLTVANKVASTGAAVGAENVAWWASI